MKIKKFPALKVTFTIILFWLASLSISISAATQIDVNGPQPGSGNFGAAVVALPNGNIVVTDPSFDITSPTFIEDVGAVYLYDKNGNLISRITGSSRTDNVGSGGIFVLNNGKFLISSPNWDLESVTGLKQNAGAVTMVNSVEGISGSVTSANSLTGTYSNDRISSNGIKVLPNNNFVITSIYWNGERGAVTFGNASHSLSGQVTELNSLVGSNPGHLFGSVTILANGNFLVHSTRGNGGSVTFCEKTSGCVGFISTLNSLVGSPGDSISSDGITILPNGNYVVRSRFWNGQRGAVTFGNGTTGTTGVVSSSNSLVGTTVNDFVGSGDGFLNAGITVLSNGNYVVISSNWDNGATVNAGAATFGSGITGVSGFISTANSLIGGSSSDFYISRLTPLTNGNFVVFLPRWSAPPGTPGGAAVFGNGMTGTTGTVTATNSLTNVNESGGVTALTNGNYVVANPDWQSRRGAATLCDGVNGTVGVVSASNSLTGESSDDSISGGGITALSNGNYVVNSSGWNSQRGASTLCNGTVGCGGTVSAANSLTGTNTFDRVGAGGATALTNGNYVVRSFYWNNHRGAASFGNGTTGIIGSVNSSNSLVGSNPNDSVGDLKIIPLPNNNYLVVSRGWNASRGAVTWGNGITGVSGEVTATNSLIGSSSGDQVGYIGNVNHGITVFDNGSYTVRSDYWDNGTAVDAGAISLSGSNVPLTGTVNSDNSVLGTANLAGFRLTYDYNSTAKQLVVGHIGYISIFRYNNTRTSFDLDGDSKTDISIFRPVVGEWWYLRSSDGGNRAFQFGASSDKIVAADYTGDGLTDIAFWRESTGEWFVLRSEDSSFYSFPFGTSGDIPTPADFDGDGLDDPAVFRPSTATWYIISSSDGGTTITTFGANGDQPVAADYDGDGFADIAIFRPSDGSWWINRSSAGLLVTNFGTSSDKTVQADYTGDGKTDVAIWRPSTGEWFILRSEDLSFYSVPFGASGDTPAPGDYDGDGAADYAVFRPSNATWYIQQSTNGFAAVGFGASGDQPVPNAFVR